MPRGMYISGIMSSSHDAQLQSTIASASANNDNSVQPHHPITCDSKIYLEEDGTFRCEHAVAPPNNVRTNQCITHSISLLLIELAMSL